MAANDDFQDDQLTRAVNSRIEGDRSEGRVRRLISLSDRDFTDWFRSRFQLTSRHFGTKRLLSFFDAARAQRQPLHADVTKQIRADLRISVINEVSAQAAILESNLPFVATIGTVSPERVAELLRTTAFQGKTINQWLASYRRADQTLIMDAIQNGMALNETPTVVARRLAGTRGAGFADGALFRSRANAQAVVQTAMTHFTQVAREEFYDANEDLISGMRWVSTLDARTSGICQRRDGKGVVIGEGTLPPGISPLVPQDARPPAHVNCRSVMVAFMKGEELVGSRPFVIATDKDRTKVDFRKIARQQKIPINTARRRWAEQNVGRVPETVDYEDFLGRQTASFQDQALGNTKGTLFREGTLGLDDFTDGRTGREFTLSQLKFKHPDAFAAAGLD